MWIYFHKELQFTGPFPQTHWRQTLHMQKMPQDIHSEWKLGQTPQKRALKHAAVKPIAWLFN
jgi:hypothetical protein